MAHVHHFLKGCSKLGWILYLNDKKFKVCDEIIKYDVENVDEELMKIYKNIQNQFRNKFIFRASNKMNL